MDEKYQLKEIKLESGTYNLIPQIEEYLINGKDLEPEVENILKTYNTNVSLSEILQKRGYDSVMARFIEVSEDFDFEDIATAVQAGLDRAQTLNPSVKLRGSPVVFLYFPNNEGAKSLRGQGCALNINDFCGKSLTPEEKRRRVQSSVAHEATHVFLKQLGVKPSEKWFNLKTFIWDFLWEEGLTTTMEVDYEDWHYSFVNDADYYIELLKDWLDPATDDSKKEMLLQQCIQRPSLLEWLSNVGMSIDRIIPDTDDIDRKFIFLMKSMNGFGYHIGNVLWQRQLDAGTNLTELVMKGSGEMSKWLDRYQSLP